MSVRQPWARWIGRWIGTLDWHCRSAALIRPSPGTSDSPATCAAARPPACCPTAPCCPPLCLQRKLKAQRRELQSLAQIQVGLDPGCAWSCAGAASCALVLSRAGGLPIDTRRAG